MICTLILNSIHNSSGAVDDLSQTDRELIKVDLGDNVDKSHPLSDATAGRLI